MDRRNPKRSARQSSVQLGGATKKIDANWIFRGGLGLWCMSLFLLIRGAYVNIQVVSSNEQSVHGHSASGSRREHQILSRSRQPGSARRQLPTINYTRKHTQEQLSPIVQSPTPPKADQPYATIAHAISFLSCGYSLTEKYKDAMLVLRHSIHQNSWHNANGTSRYSYQMYAFVNDDPDARCAKYAGWIQRMGYIPLLLPNPINLTAIENEWFRGQIDKTGVAGSSELIKLYLYSLTDHPIVCHWDIDVIIKKPMDDLFDAILYDKRSIEGKRARSRLQIQQPLHQRLPDQIDAFLTRDVALAKPWFHRQVAQGGFLVARTDKLVLEKYVEIIQAANFSSKCGDEGGWGNLGYGCQMGAMHYQGIVAYYYDHIHAMEHPNTGAVELDTCAWNQIGHSVTYDTGLRPEYIGACRQAPIYGGTNAKNRPEWGACHDCRILPLDQTNTIHYTACAKPWQCKWKELDPSKAATATTNSTTCALLIREFYDLRRDLELQLEQKTGLVATSSRFIGDRAFHPEIFLDYCGYSRKGDIQYAGMTGLPETFDMKELYGF